MIRYFNRATQRIEDEIVYGGKFVELAYKNKIGFALTDFLFSKRWLSLLMGAFESSTLSSREIKPFIEAYKIKMSDFEETSYSNFNDFFIRKFKPGIRNFDSDEKVFCAGAEARYLAFENIKADQRFTVKGFDINLSELLKNKEWGAEFEGGTFIVARLCPVDYHRFHFPTSGVLVQRYRVSGALHSVNPVVFEAEPKVFLRNEREVSLFETPRFGKVAMIEVGALGVGKIVQTATSPIHSLPQKFDKGAEKGYFLFGGSTVIWLLQKGKLELSSDLRTNSLDGLETWIPLGSALGEEKNEVKA